MASSASSASSLSDRDQWIVHFDSFLRSVVAPPPATLPARFGTDEDSVLSDDERREAAALMRVNHVGEICAQALYRAQALHTTDPVLREKFSAAAEEEKAHLDWTRTRIEQLGGRPSLLNPFWSIGAFTIGLCAGKFGNAVSLGFMAETERQVEQHLDSHLDRLPAADTVSRNIVQQMKEDEARHADQAIRWGGLRLPHPIRLLMRGASKLMTTVAHRV